MSKDMKRTNKICVGDVLVDQYYRLPYPILVLKIHDCGIVCWIIDTLEEIKGEMKIFRGQGFSRDELQKDFIIFRKGKKMWYYNGTLS